jgi:hypothetical protein
VNDSSTREARQGSSAKTETSDPTAGFCFDTVVHIVRQEQDRRSLHVKSKSAQPMLEVTIAESVEHLRRKKRSGPGIARISL